MSYVPLIPIFRTNLPLELPIAFHCSLRFPQSTGLRVVGQTKKTVLCWILLKKLGSSATSVILIGWINGLMISFIINKNSLESRTSCILWRISHKFYQTNTPENLSTYSHPQHVSNPYHISNKIYPKKCIKTCEYWMINLSG